ncbi:FHA domain-containing protein [bacterium CPR1]|nr:FHA domain-containing protein [bacterium CPR1]
MDEIQTRVSLSARLTVQQGYAAGATFLVEHFPAILGRGKEADVRLSDDPSDPTLSRRHARLSLGGGRLSLQDLSTNGTSLGQRLLRADEVVSLADREELWLGPRTCLLVETLRPAGAILQETACDPAPPAPGPGEGVVPLQIQALGNFSVALQGRPIPEAAWETRKTALLLVYLAWRHERPVPAERICADLWPDHHAGGRQALQTTLARLRRALRSGSEESTLPDPVLRQRGSYGLNPVYRLGLDVLSFESAWKRARMASGSSEKMRALEEARRLYAGELMEGYGEEWVLTRRQMLLRTYQEAMAGLGDLLRAHDQGEEALRLYRALLEDDPVWELGHQGLLLTLIEGGQRDEAVRHYHRYVESMKRLLNLAPSAEMLSLYHRLLA